MDYINCGRLGQDILEHVTKSTEKLINRLVQENGITIADNTLEQIYHFTVKKVTDDYESLAAKVRQKDRIGLDRIKYLLSAYTSSDPLISDQLYNTYYHKTSDETCPIS